MPNTNPPKPLPVSKFAELAGVSAATIREAIKTGRLSESVVMVGSKAKIADFDQAIAELKANTRAKSDGHFAPTRDAEGPDSGDDISFNEARRLREIEVWRITKTKREIEQLNLSERRGELIDTEEVRQTVLDEYANIRTRFLGLSTRIRQRIQSLSAADLTIIDKLIREALESLSDGE